MKEFAFRLESFFLAGCKVIRCSCPSLVNEGSVLAAGTLLPLTWFLHCVAKWKIATGSESNRNQRTWIRLS